MYHVSVPPQGPPQLSFSGEKEEERLHGVDEREGPLPGYPAGEYVPGKHFPSSASFANSKQRPENEEVSHSSEEVGNGVISRENAPFHHDETDAWRHLNEDFFTDPINKLLRHGRFPFKLATNLAMLVFVIVIATLYHTPESMASERQRKTVLTHFLGTNYLGKDKGDIVLRPTVYLDSREDVLDSIENFVSVYYDLSNTSVSELKYYYYSNPNGGAPLLQRLLTGENPQRVREVQKLLQRENEEDDHGSVKSANSNNNDGGLNLSWVQPVSMDVDLFVYSLQEHRGPSASRHFTFTLTEKDPLGPFAYDKDKNGDDGDSTDTNSREDTDTYHQIISSTPLANHSQTEMSSPALKDKMNRKHLTGAFIQANELDVVVKDKRRSITSPRKNASTLRESNYVEAACAPRFDTMTRMYYNPCRGTIQDGVERFFPLLGNVRTIRLRAALRHLSDSTGDADDASYSGFSAVLYHWMVEKVFQIHPGGLVEVTFSASSTTRRIGPRPHPRFFLAAALLLLACADVALHLRALRRIHMYRRKLAAKQWQRDGNESLQSCSPEISAAIGDSSIAPDFAKVTSGSSPFHLPGASRDVVMEGAATTSAKESFNGTVDRLRRALSWPSSQKKPSFGRNAGTLMPETTYTDFDDIWKQQLQQSQGEGWQYLGILADVITAVYSVMALVKLCELSSTLAFEVFEAIFLGLSGLLLSISLLSYLRYFPQVYFTVRATRQVIPRLLAFVSTVAPVFIGFAFFYFIVFGPHSKGEFTDIGFAFVGLYFMMYGDALLPAIENAEGSVYLIVVILANAMTVIFVLLFMMTMLNLAMSITQQEWGMMRRRFGACLSVGNMLFTVRTREQVRLETTETIIANLELLLHICHEEQMFQVDIRDDVNSEDAGTVREGVAEENTVSQRGSFVYQDRDVSNYLRLRLNELTEGALNNND